jgi:hypothetical protein
MLVILVSICPRKPNGRTQFLSFDLEHRNVKKKKKKKKKKGYYGLNKNWYMMDICRHLILIVIEDAKE